MVGVDPTSGETRWKGPGGGSSTPVTHGDLLIVHGKPEEVGVIAYQAGKDKITEIWRFPKLTRRADSSPLVYDGKVFLMGAGMRLCLDLESGELLRKFPAKHDISSPVLLNGQILTYEINGSFLQLLDAEPDRLNDGQKFKIGALKCTSPSLLGSNLIIRHANGLSCFDLRDLPLDSSQVFCHAHLQKDSRTSAYLCFLHWVAYSRVGLPTLRPMPRMPPCQAKQARP